MSEHLISVIVPVYKQADHIESVISEYIDVLSKLKIAYELILAVNGPCAKTLESCSKFSKKFPQIRVVHTEKTGWGRAVRMGLEEAKGDILCYVNSARTNAHDLGTVLIYALTNPDVVVKACRKIRDNWQRRLGSLLYNLQCRALFDLSYWDINGTPKVFPRKFDKLLGLSRNDDLIDAEFNIICRNNGYRVIEVPIFCIKRKSGSSTTNYNSAIKMYWGAYNMWRSMRNKREQ